MHGLTNGSFLGWHCVMLICHVHSRSILLSLYALLRQPYQCHHQESWISLVRFGRYILDCLLIHIFSGELDSGNSTFLVVSMSWVWVTPSMLQYIMMNHMKQFTTFSILCMFYSNQVVYTLHFSSVSADGTLSAYQVYLPFISSYSQCWSISIRKEILILVLVLMFFNLWEGPLNLLSILSVLETLKSFPFKTN